MNTETVGVVKKCPNCGAVIESFQTRCNSCGFELSGQKVIDSLQNFVAEIAKWDDESYKNEDYVQSKNGKNVQLKKIGTFAWIIMWLFGIAPFVLLYRYIKKLTGKSGFAMLVFVGIIFVFTGISAIGEGETTKGILMIAGTFIALVVFFLLLALFAKPVLTSVDKRKEKLITDFPVPNSKEDILEFVSFSVSHIKHYSTAKKLFTVEGKKQNYWNVIWEDKCKQLYTKARLSMSSDPATLKVVKEMMTDSGIKLN